MKAIKAGELRHPVTIIQRSDSQNTSTGEMNETWSTFASVWASITTTGGKFVDAGQLRQLVGIRTLDVEIRYLPGLTDEMRVVYNGRTFTITSINNDEQRNYRQTLNCTET